MDLGKGPSDRAAQLLRDFPMLEALRTHDRSYVDGLVQLVQDCAEFNRHYARPAALEIDQRARDDHDYFAWETARAACRYGLYSIIIPRKLGGWGGLAVAFSLAMEELCATCAGIANIFGANALGIAPLLTSGSLACWDTHLAETARAEKAGDPLIWGYVITEPSAGTDVEEPHFLDKAKLSMQAKRVDGGYVLNGRKCFISNGAVARYLTVTTCTDKRHPLETWTLFLVDREMPGFSVVRNEVKMGQRACLASELLFEDVFVPRENVLGLEGDGMDLGALLVLAASRAPVGAIATGIARGALEHFLAWARTPRGGRRPLEQQRIQMALADMHIELQKARWAYLNAALAFDHSLGKVLFSPLTQAVLTIPEILRTSAPYQKLMKSRLGKGVVFAIMRAITSEQAVTQALAMASLAKVVGGDTAMAVTSRCLELMGTCPCEERRWVEKAFRDAKLTQIYEGTNQLNRLTLYMAGIEGTLGVKLPEPLRLGVV
jgi:alkylation response protein AidB-like acyl-CoA dehydrogenase